MAKVIKNIGDSISGIFGATNIAIQSTAKVVESVANSTVNLVDGMGASTSNLIAVSNNYTEELLADSEYSKKKNTMVNEAKGKALETVLANKVLLTKLEKAESDALVRDIFEDYDLEPELELEPAKAKKTK